MLLQRVRLDVGVIVNSAAYSEVPILVRALTVGLDIEACSDPEPLDVLVGDVQPATEIKATTAKEWLSQLQVSICIRLFES